MQSQNHFNLSQPTFTINENDFNEIKITMTMQENYSELSKFKGEMTITIPATGNPQITINNQADYNNALTRLLKNHNRDYGCEGN